MTKCISDCMLQFRIRTNMVELKANMKGMYKDGDYSCLGCGARLQEMTRATSSGVQHMLTSDKD